MEALAPVGQVMLIESLRHDTTINRGEKETKVLAGQTALFSAKEKKDVCCESCSCLFVSDMTINVVDGSDNTVFKMTRGRMCCTWCSFLPCCRTRIFVKDKEGNELGKAQEDCQFFCDCYPNFTTYDATGKAQYGVGKNVDICRTCCGPYCTCCCCVKPLDETFEIEPKGDNNGESGTLTRLLKRTEISTGKDDNYTLNFPTGATVENKILIIAAALVVDYTMYDTATSGEKK